MKQTESAVRMLIRAYKSVLTNCYIKENLLGGGKRLVKGAALSSFLSAVLAGVSSSYSYAETISGPISVSENNPQSVEYLDDSYVFNSDGQEETIISSNNAKLNIGFTGEGEDEQVKTSKIDIKQGDNGIVATGSKADIKITVTEDIALDDIQEKGIEAKGGAEVHLTAGNSNTLYVEGQDAIGINVQGKVNISDSSSQQEFKYSKVSLISKQGNNEIKSEYGTGIKVDSAIFQAISEKASNIISGGNIGIDINKQGTVEISAIEDNFIGDEAQIKNPVKNAIVLNDFSSISLLANKSNNIYAGESGILASNNSNVLMKVVYYASEESNLNSILKHNIFVNKEDSNKGGIAFGVKAINGSSIEINSVKNNNSEVSENDKEYIPTINTTIKVQTANGNVMGIIADDSSLTETETSGSQVKIDGSNLSVTVLGSINANDSEKLSAIESISNGIVDSKVDATLLSNIDVSVSGKTQNGYGLKAENDGVIILNSTNGGYVNINVNTDNVNQQTGYGIYSSGDVDVTSVKNTIIASLDGVNFSSGTVDITSSATSLLSRSIDKVSDYNIIIGSDGTGVHAAQGADGEFNAIATSGDNCIAGAENAIWSEPSEEVKKPKILVKAEYGSNFIGFDKDVYVDGVVGKNGIYAQSGEVTIKAGVRNEVNSYQKGIFVDNLAEVNLISGELNLITAKNNPYEEFGKGYAIYSLSGGSVTLEALDTNQLVGAVYASGSDTNVFIGGIEEDEVRAARENRIYSYAYISGAGDLGDDPEGAFEGKNVISALYAEGGANIELSGISNDLRTYAEYQNEDQLERVIWAYNGKVGEEKAKGTSISINGYSYIATDSYEKSPNSLDIAIAAGTAVGLNEDDVNTPINLEDRAKVELTYADLVNEDGSTRHSFISGDILSAYDGLVNINPKNGSNAGINIEGNLLAGNNGIVNVDLGNGGTLTGRADDYGDAGVENLNGGHQNMTFFDPEFSSKIFSGGEVNLTMGENSRWNVTRQSWITRINTSYDEISDSTARIDLIPSNTDRNEAAHSLTVYELRGNAIFNMSLDGNRDVSDMLYIKNADGEYTVNVIDAVTVADMYANEHTGLRFATLGAGSHASFRAITWDGGVNNVEYEVDTDDYDTSTENTAYNGASLTDGKPGDDTVDTFFGSDGKPGSTTPAENADENIETQTVAANVKLAKAVVENADIETTAASDTLNTDATNYKLVAVKSSEISDGGKTVIDMSRANYANAVYMDTLNKRQGEARFVGSTDHGVWVRLRHDNIGKDDSFRTHNTMVEVGFEQRDVNDYGEFHTGFALDYMNGQIDYHTVDGDGDIERYGVWFYTTFLGNDGQYADLILKYGHLKNDFGFNTKSQGEHVTGDYTNEVASISAEYGWKFSNSYNYYIEPQVQLQYSYVTGADYTTSQGSKVDLDSIHSLIGRVGFRAGKDFNTETPITAYIRGDVLHEFLGDQDIYAYDNTGVMDVTYENDDTWYSAGVGLSVQSSENTYFFIEGEQVFGADNDSTYTVSGGFKHSF